MANYSETSKNFTAQYMTGLAGVNTGLIIPWGSASVPSGFLECNGQAVSQATYAALYAVIGYTYGNPGGGNFNLPDLQDRTIVNKSNTKSLAQTGGANTVASQGNVSGNLANYTLSTAEIASHTHGNFRKDMFFSGVYPAIGGAPGSYYGGPSSNTGGGGAHTHSLSSPVFSGDSTSVLQPYLVLIYIIKT